MDDYQALDYFVFYSENQGVCAWGIKKEDIALDNPPVYENYDENEWFKTTDTLTEFLNSMSYLQFVFGSEYSNEGYLTITKEQAGRIAENFQSKQVDSNLYTGVKFYGDYDDTVIVVMKDSDNFVLMFGAHTENHYDETEENMERIL